MFIFLTAGNNDVAPEGKERIFLGFPHCRAALDLRKDQNYLIMGASKDIHVDRRDKLYVIMLVWVPGGDLHDLIGPTYSCSSCLKSLICACFRTPQVSVCSRWENLGGVLAHRVRVWDWATQAHLPGHGKAGSGVHAVWLPAIKGRNSNINASLLCVHINSGRGCAKTVLVMH